MRKVAGAFAGIITVGCLFLVVPIVGITVGVASATCSNGDPVHDVNVKAVIALVRSILVSSGDKAISVAGLDDPVDQVPNAKTITATGVAMRVPARGQVVALATALQESGLRNLAYGDRDSLGLFQQRPSQGWGTAAEVMDPVHASARFYAALRKVPGWESLAVAQAAQAVQRSAFPDAYAKWEPLAAALQKAIEPLLSQGSGPPNEPVASPVTGVAAGIASRCSDGTPGSTPDGSLPAGYVVPVDVPRPVQVAIRWALDQLGTPYQSGGHCTSPHGPDPMGRCDCSSLVQQSYRQAGTTQPRTTYEQVNTGEPVSVRALRPGDLVFTGGSTAAPEHVGMYVGSGLVVNAPYTGAVVRVEALASWQSRLVAARRVL